MIKNIKWLAFLALAFVACNNDDDIVVNPNTSDGLTPTAGTADFSNFVALGDSFAAGFSDNALFIEGQKGAYPNIMAQQFALVGGGEFRNPLMSDNIGGFASGGAQIPQFGPRLYFNGAGPAPVPQISTTEISARLSGSFNNMGVPGARSYHLTFPGYGSAAGNPYFARFASTPSATVVEDALAQNPTFFSLWIGGNDILGYATSGGLNAADITAPATFDAVYNSIAGQMAANGKKGVVANLPYVNSLPYFITVPTKPIPALPAANAAQLNQIFGGINQITTALGQPNRFVALTADDNNPATTEATNPLLIVDESLPNISTFITGALTPLLGAATATYLGNLYGQARHARNTLNDSDFILLPTRSLISPPNNIQAGAPAPFDARGVTYPLQDSAVLTADEALQVKNATDAYNITIQAAATTNGLAFVDTKETMNQLSSVGGIIANNYTLSSTYVTGGAFSLDGIHPTPRGYALIANLFLKAINEKYGSNFKAVSMADYRILFPPVLP